MKRHLPLVLTLAGSLFTLSANLHAQPVANAARRAEVVEMMQDPQLARAAFAEMMKSREKKQYMAQVMARDPEFRRFYAAEIGSGAPHQERNPSDHPELFGVRKP